MVFYVTEDDVWVVYRMPLDVLFPDVVPCFVRLILYLYGVPQVELQSWLETGQSPTQRRMEGGDPVNGLLCPGGGGIGIAAQIIIKTGEDIGMGDMTYTITPHAVTDTIAVDDGLFHCHLSPLIECPFQPPFLPWMFLRLSRRYLVLVGGAREWC